MSSQGKDAVPFLETLVVGDVAGIKNGSGSLSVFTNENGGIIDDTVITKVSTSKSYYPVTVVVVWPFQSCVPVSSHIMYYIICKAPI